MWSIIEGPVQVGPTWIERGYYGVCYNGVLKMVYGSRTAAQAHCNRGHSE